MKEQGMVKILLTRSVSKDATVAVSLSKHMRGEPSGGILQEQKDDLSKSNRVIIYM